MRGSVVVLAGFVGLLGFSVVAQADPAAPASAPAAPTVTAAAPTDDPNEMICKTMAPTTGTRLGARRECQTRHQWDMEQQQAQREVQENQRLGLTGGIPGN